MTTFPLTNLLIFITKSVFHTSPTSLVYTSSQTRHFDLEMISVQEWTVKYETALEEKGLLEWVISVDDGPLQEDSEAAEGGVKPVETRERIAWKKTWMIVKNCLERCLGEDCGTVYSHPDYRRIEEDADCSAIKRIVIIGRLLRELVSKHSLEWDLADQYRPSVRHLQLRRARL